MHGYELRKRVTGLLGWGRVLSYGSLYPCLKQMLRDGLITEDTTDAGRRPAPAAGRRGKIVYKLTAEGKERFATLVSAAGPSAWEDENFGVHFAFFGSTNAETRLRILEGRRSRLEERLDGVRTTLARSRERVDSLHPGAAAPRPRVGRARGPLADRADRQRAGRAEPPGSAPTGRSATPPRAAPPHHQHRRQPPSGADNRE